MYWILKTEPSCYSFSDLTRDKKTSWDGVRNYQARNNLRSMKKGDLALIYHSVGPRDLVGIVTVTKEAFPDDTALDGDWVAVEVKPLKKLNQPVNLAVLKADPRLKNLSLVKQGRLSVCPVEKKEWDAILELAATALKIVHRVDDDH